MRLEVSEVFIAHKRQHSWLHATRMALLPYDDMGFLKFLGGIRRLLFASRWNHVEVVVWLSFEVSKVFLRTKHFLLQIRLDLHGVVFCPEMSVILKLLKFLKKLKFFREIKQEILMFRATSQYRNPHPPIKNGGEIF